MTLRLLTHNVRLDGTPLSGYGSPLLVTVSMGEVPVFETFDGCEVDSTVFINGTTDITTDSDGRVVEVRAGKRGLI